MRLDFFVMMLLGLAIIGCSSVARNNPVIPSPGSDERVLTLYAMTFRPALILNAQARDAQDFHDAIDLVEENSEFPHLGDYFRLAAELVDYDRGANILTVDFTVTNTVEDHWIFDPRLVFFFNYNDDAIHNEPSDLYQLANADLLFNIDRNGNISGDYQPAVRVIQASSSEASLAYGLENSRVARAEIRIPPPGDLVNSNYEPIRWDILVEGTLSPNLHIEPLDILNARVSRILESGNEGIKGELTCTLKLAVPVANPLTDVTVTANLSDFGGSSEHEMELLLPVVDEYMLNYRVKDIHAGSTPPSSPPYNIRMTAVVDGSGGWNIQDDAYAYVVPKKEQDSDRKAGKYWVVYLQEDVGAGGQLTGRNELWAINTVDKIPIRLTSYLQGGVLGAVFHDYSNFRNLSLAPLGEENNQDNSYRLIFEAEKGRYTLVGDIANEFDDTVKCDLDILGIEITFTNQETIDAVHAGPVVQEVYDYSYGGLQYVGIGVIEREPRISPDGNYVVYEHEWRENVGDEAYDVTRVYVVQFNLVDDPSVLREVITQDSDGPVVAPIYAVAAEPSIGSPAPNQYIVAYTTNTDFAYEKYYSGLGFVGLTRLDLQGGNDEVGPRFGSVAPGPGLTDYLHSAYLSPDAQYISFIHSAGGFSWAYVADVLTGNLTLNSVYGIDTAGLLFQYHPVISGNVGIVNGINWGEAGHHRMVYREGNNKNADVYLYFTGDVPGVPGSGLYQVSDQDSNDNPWWPDPWRDDRAHDSGMDISADGLGIVWTSAKYSTGDIYFLDLQNLSDVSGDAAKNQEELANVVRLTYTGRASEPQISNFINVNYL